MRSPRPEAPLRDAATTDDAVLGGKLKLLQPANGHRAGHDARLLAAGAKLVLIHRPDALETILAALTGRFGAAEIIAIFPRPDAAAIRVIVRAIKGRRTPPSLRPGLVLNDAEGRPTPTAEAIL